MNKRDFPRLAETYYEQVLENGLRVRVIRKKGFARYHCFLAADYGSLDSAFCRDGQRIRTPDGVAHYLEHKMFDLPEENAMQAFSRLGGSPNAFTSYAMTAYYVDCTDNPMENLELLLRMVYTPYFTQQSVEKERGIISQEIRMYEDSPDSRVYENLFASLYKTHPIRIPIAGTVESIQGISAQTLRDCYDTFYDPANMVLCVAGDLEPEDVIRLAERVVPASRAVRVQREYGPLERLTTGIVRTKQTMEVSMPSFAFGFSCQPGKTGEAALREELLGDLAAEILAGESTPLYTKLYEQGLIDCDFSGGYESVKQAAFLSFSGDSKDPEAVFEALVQEADRLSRRGLDAALFARLKKSAMGRRLRSLDSLESCCYRCAASVLEGAEYFRFPELYQSITLEETAAFLREVIRPEQAAISVIEPQKEEAVLCSR